MRPLLVLVALFVTRTVFAGDPRCEGEPKVRAARFGAAALKGQTDAKRLDTYVKACALDEVVALTTALIAFETVGAEVPAGKSPAFAAMAQFLERWAKEHGFTFHAEPGNAVFEIIWGQGPRRLGFITHGDVVPAPPAEWKRAPFRAEVDGGMLFGRGAEDDKGPLAVALVTMALARELGLTPRGQVVTVVGNGEESDWDGMTAYAKKLPHPTYVISLDSGYPVVVAQTGFVAWHLEAALGAVAPLPGKWVPTDVSAGEFLTQVPGVASLTFSGPKGSEARVKKAIAQLKQRRADLSAEVKASGAQWILTTHGNAVHSSTADQGHNALWDLAALCELLPLSTNGISDLLRVVARRFDGDHYGTKLELAQEDPLMGKLLVAADMLHVKDGKVLLDVNIRRPQGMDAPAFRERLKRALALAAQEVGGRVKEGEEAYVGDPAVADTQGPLVKTLLDIYRTHQGQPDAGAVSVRGGTYARLFPGAVDFGPSFPGEPYSGHSHDEAISLHTLQATAEMTAQALYRLAVAPGP